MEATDHESGSKRVRSEADPPTLHDILLKHGAAKTIASFLKGQFLLTASICRALRAAVGNKRTRTRVAMQSVELLQYCLAADLCSEYDEDSGCLLRRPAPKQYSSSWTDCMANGSCVLLSDTINRSALQMDAVRMKCPTSKPAIVLAAPCFKSTSCRVHGVWTAPQAAASASQCGSLATVIVSVTPVPCSAPTETQDPLSQRRAEMSGESRIHVDAELRAATAGLRSAVEIISNGKAPAAEGSETQCLVQLHAQIAAASELPSSSAGADVRWSFVTTWIGLLQRVRAALVALDEDEKANISAQQSTASSPQASGRCGGLLACFSGSVDVSSVYKPQAASQQ